MRTLKSRIIVVVMALVLFVTGVFALRGIQSRKVEALSPIYRGGDTVYYFSDSTPIIPEEELKSEIKGRKIVYDIQPLISEQKLEFLIYTGYFWGFDGSDTLVIVELKTMKPDTQILTDLFTCLKYQNCKIIFVTPYKDFEYEQSDKFIEYVDNYKVCDKDMFSTFIDYSVIDMARRNLINRGFSFDSSQDWLALIDAYAWNNFWEKTCILIDGRFIGIEESSENNYYSEYTLAYSTFFQRLILDMFYGPESDERADFEFNLYRGLWQFYIENCFGEIMSELVYGQIDILQMIEKWQKYSFVYDDYVYSYGEAYEEYYRELIWNYYYDGKDEKFEEVFDGIFKIFSENNIHILIHITGSDSFWDFLSYNVKTETNTWSFTEVEQFFVDNDDISVYAMGIWTLDTPFYNFLYNEQYENGEYIIKGAINEIYIWEEDVIEWGEGGLVITDSNKLFDDYNIEFIYLIDFSQLKNELLGIIKSLL